VYTKTPGNGLLCLEMKMNKCTTSFGKLLGGAGVKQFKQAGKLKSGGCKKKCMTMDEKTKEAYGLKEFRKAAICRAPTPAASSGAAAPKTQTVTIGSSRRNTKTVSANVTSCTSPCGKGCRKNSDHQKANNRFEVTVKKGKVTARRLDSRGGWGMNLQVPCQ